VETEWTGTTTVLKGGRIEVVVPLLEEGLAVEVVVRRDHPASRSRRKFGSAKGQVVIRADFDEPLDEFEEYS
jgi:hypothetical protein